MEDVYCTNYTYSLIHVSGIRSKIPFSMLGNVWKEDISDIIHGKDEDRLLSKKLLFTDAEGLIKCFIEQKVELKNLKYHTNYDCELMRSDYLLKEWKVVNGKRIEVVTVIAPNSGVTLKLEALIEKLEKIIEYEIQEIREKRTFSKHKLITSIEKYYELRFNPKGGIKLELLTGLGFVCCSKCAGQIVYLSEFFK